MKLKILAHFVYEIRWGLYGAALRIYKCMHRISLAQLLSVAKYFVFDFYFDAWTLFYGGSYRQNIVETRGADVFYPHFQNGQVAALRVQVAVRQTDGIEHLNSCGFKPRKVVAVVGNAHGVGFRKAHPDFCFGRYH